MSAALDHPHLARCSADLRAATAAVEAWGRKRWPGARVIHEMRVGGCRLDTAFVLPDRMIGVEIKSDRDTLSRLDTQIRHYAREIPELWVAVAPRFIPKLSELPWRIGRIVVEGGAVAERFQVDGYNGAHEARVDEMLTAPMLHLLWRAEAVGLARVHQIKLPARMPLHTIVKVLARRLTGDQIVVGVCGALRARPVNFAADPPSAWPHAADQLAPPEAPDTGRAA